MIQQSRLLRLAVLLAGLILGQFVLYGPSLFGSRILLPLDVLTAPGICLPPSETHGIHPENFYLSDLVYLSEPMRRFAHGEFAAGRFPAWADYQFAGAPFLGPRFSPFVLPQYLVASPRIIPWMQLVAACVAGVGMFAFARRVLDCSFSVALTVGWAYPLTAFFIFWQGYYLVWPVYWLPWLLTLIYAALRQPQPWTAPTLAGMTTLILVSGNLDTAGQTLLVGGLFALALLCTRLAPAEAAPFHRSRRLAALATSFVLGLLLAAPYLLPVIEYSRTGSRIQLRAEGHEERPPVGLSALPQIVLPDMYGAQAKARTGFRYARETQIESSAGAYAGVAASLLLAPLAFQDRRRRPLAIFLAATALLGASWCLNLPGLVQLLRLPGLNFMSHNRFVFATGFSLLALAALGLQQLRDQSSRRSLILPALLLGGFLTWCGYRALVLPPALLSLPGLLQSAGPLGWIADADSVAYVQEQFRLHYAVAAALCLTGLTIACLAASRPALKPQLAFAASTLLLIDLLWFSHGRNPQSSPDLYYPPLPALSELQQKAEPASAPGRVIAYKTLPPQLLRQWNLRDVRGYDGVDPARFLELISLAGHQAAAFDYAALQWFTPEVGLSPEGDVLLHPVLNLLGVTHVIFRGSPNPQAKPVLAAEPYWILRNPNALPRAFVPARVEVIPKPQDRLRRLADPAFDPRSVALLEAPTPLDPTAQARGVASLQTDTPTQLSLELHMETPGLVLLTDLWDPGWQARLNGQPVPVLLVNHALRGVVAPPGASRLEFFYRPRSFQVGLQLAAFAAALTLAWLFLPPLLSRTPTPRTP